MTTSRYCFLDKPWAVLVTQVMQGDHYAARVRAKGYVIDTKYDGQFGNHGAYVALLPVCLQVFTVCNATHYVPLVVAEIARWKTASDNDDPRAVLVSQTSGRGAEQ